MSATLCSILPFFWFILIATITSSLVLCHGSWDGGCISSEREALLKLKSGLKDPSNRLASWDSEAECCQWYGVICDNFTGHVLELHLASTVLSDDQYDTLLDDSRDFEEYLEGSNQLGGKISQSLLKLKHLRYLDLSNNDFGGIHIPKFLGSMASLRYLDLGGAGFGGMIPRQLGNLSNLQYLNLQPVGEHYSYDTETHVESLGWISSLSSLEFLDLSYVNLSKAFDWLEVLNKLPSLVELHLSNCQLNPPIPPLPSVNFSSLAILDLSGNTNSGVMPSWISSLASLASLNLSGNHFPAGPIPVHLKNLTYIKELDLSVNAFNSSIPDWLFNCTHLEVMDLSDNNFQGEIPSATGELTALNMLDLSANSLEGEIPSTVGNLVNLTSLDLSNNNLEGGIPTSFKNLCNLNSLSLHQVNLSQEINEIIEILSRCISGKLESLDLSDSQLSGHFTTLLGQFKKLARLDLSQNLMSGQIPVSLGEMTSLTYLDLSFNKLNGNLPLSFGRLAKLESLYISDNLLEGEISEAQFANLTSLKKVDASGNHLILRVNPDWVPRFQLVEDVNLRYWNVGPQFPAWLPYLKRLKYLDLSNSKISSTIPIWFHNFSSTLYQFNLSHNQMHGKIQNLSIDDSDYSLIDLSSNYFEGPLPYTSSSPGGLDLSNNLFSGSVTNFLCNKLVKRSSRALSIEVLNLKENHLSGEIPDCWMYWNSLRVIDLSGNNFSGNIPKLIGGLRDLRILNLGNNNLHGEIPLSLSYCEELMILDLGENELGGEIPSWVGYLQRIRILNFRGNKFHGSLLKLCGMTYLQILDLANNNLNDTIPICINNLEAMFSEEGYSEGAVDWAYGPHLEYMGSSSIVRKGQMVHYSTTLGFVKSLDLSNNQLFGEIPEEVTSLDGLQSLNLSHNFLTGRIPGDIGAMKALESLDLSGNQLFGEIPHSMSSLTFLSNLNLSNNKLSGQIPSGTQLQSLNSSSFSGNHLCGPPLTKSCSMEEAKPPGIHEEIDHGNGDGVLDWFYFYVSMAPGFVVGFWVIMGPLVFNRRWRNLYFNFLGRLWNSMLAWFYVSVFRFVWSHG